MRGAIFIYSFVSRCEQKINVISLTSRLHMCMYFLTVCIHEAIIRFCPLVCTYMIRFPVLLKKGADIFFPLFSFGCRFRLCQPNIELTLAAAAKHHYFNA